MGNVAVTSPTRLLILGSCVSRDILNYQHGNKQLVLVDYYARCSLASLGAQPVDMPSSVQNIGSKFQRRMVERDIRKDFLTDLAGLQFDILLIDLIDERFNLYVESGGKACTLSGELVSSGFSNDSDRGSIIDSGSEEFWRLWEAGWMILVDKLRHLGHLDRLRVNQVFWAVRTEDGGDFEPNYPGWRIGSANEFLARMYRRISADIPSEQFLGFGQGLMTGSTAHKWGISPFHYIDTYYDAAIQQLCAWSSLNKGITLSKETVPILRADYSIEKVILEREGDVLVASVVCEAPLTGQFAFYVFRSEERIHTQWYSPNTTLRIDIKAEPGLYRVLAFFRTLDGKTIKKYSNPVSL